MALSIHFTSGTVKDVAAAWHRAVQRGDPHPLTRMTALRLRGAPLAPASRGVCPVRHVHGLCLGHSLSGAWRAGWTYRRSPGRPPKLITAQKAQLQPLLDAGRKPPATRRARGPIRRSRR
ncbi:MAG: hypothetical protein M3Z04_07950 [Chloroflexota bacterium]|nr:hypothetical protein [Chloroflexota bacterium]